MIKENSFTWFEIDLEQKLALKCLLWNLAMAQYGFELWIWMLLHNTRPMFCMYVADSQGNMSQNPQQIMTKTSFESHKNALEPCIWGTKQSDLYLWSPESPPFAMLKKQIFPHTHLVRKAVRHIWHTWSKCTKVLIKQLYRCAWMLALHVCLHTPSVTV